MLCKACSDELAQPFVAQLFVAQLFVAQLLVAQLFVVQRFVAQPPSAGWLPKHSGGPLCHTGRSIKSV